MTSLLRKLWYSICHLLPNSGRGELGSILILAALSSVVVIGSAGLAVDVSRMYAARAEISRAVDAAALAGVLEFNGDSSGLTAAQTTAQAYMTANEPAATSTITPNGATNKMTIKASKSVKLYFLSLFGFNTASVYGHAVAGFQDQTIDAVMVIDSTYSMNGAPITNAKTAATNFKNGLLGTSPSGNVYVGIAPLRGCYRPSPGSDSDCVYNTVLAGTVYVKDLTSNSSALDSAIAEVTPGGMSATNVCTGLGKGYEVVNSSSGYATGHQSNPKNRRYLVLLSDGDNVYFGDHVYAAGPPASPNTFSIGSTNYACQPPNTCTGWGTPCHNGTYSSGAITVSSDGFETGNFTGGSGWTGNWTSVNSPSVTSSNAQAGTYKAQLNNSDGIYRQLNLGTVSGADLKFYVRTSGSWSTSDRFYVDSSPDGSTWTNRETFGIYGSGQTTIGSTYGQFSISLSSLVGDSSSYVRFRTSITSGSSNYAFIDTVTVSDPNTSSDGYLNGQDGQSVTSCSETPVARERQVDVATLNIANAIKAQNVEIFVVAFSACANGDGSTVYNNSGNVTCQSQTNPISSAPASGHVGDTTTETTANTRLAKCIASSKAGTNDHFWYATDASDLPNIFTTIAAQIAHRLVE